jgi:ArsR family transcriptional regulator, arsenate/arsenite/antimonite-responsive transcriptional repressor
MPSRLSDKKLCCPPTTQSLQAKPSHANAFKALAHMGRLKVFFHLVKAEEPLAVNQVQKALRLPAPTLSHHLDHLERAGLITRIKRERFIYSEVCRETTVDLARLLTACC